MFCSFCCFFKQKTAYEMRISDWSSDVCSSDLNGTDPGTPTNPAYAGGFPNAASGARAFAVNAGVSYQASGSPTLDANGVLTDAGDLGINDARAVDVAGDASVVVGRYVDGAPRFRNFNTPQIGRASCRERVCQYGKTSVVAVSLKQKTNKD